MNSPRVCRVALPVPLHRLFDYLPPAGESLPPVGCRVRAPFGNRVLSGLVVEHGRSQLDDPSTLRRLTEVFDEDPVDSELLALLRWAVDYYAAPPGMMLNAGLPGALRRASTPRAADPGWLQLTDAGSTYDYRRAPRQREAAELLRDRPRPAAELIAHGLSGAVLRQMRQRGLIEPTTPRTPPPEDGPTLNPEQRACLATLLRFRHGFGTVLLAGVTGSGKTEVYLQAARHLLRRDRQVLVLVPEIGLTPQFVRRLERRLGETAWVYHSALSEGERLATWRAARDFRARLVIGTRSAVFLPLARPGLIVIDEEHDHSFKQFDGMRYNARDVAVMRAKRLGIPIVLGSATPALESLVNAWTGRYRLARLARRAGAAEPPTFEIEDLRGVRLDQGLSPALLARIRSTLAEGAQVLIYRNRRGFAPVLICDECGWHAECPACSANLTLHRNTRRLRCHHCGHDRVEPRHCPDCGAPALSAVGAGTERLEAVLEQHFPDVPVLRFDRDAVRGREGLERRLAQVADGKPCVLVGTQMLAKGHHLPGIALSAMLDADAMLFSADFRAPERLAQAAIQVAGRSGRGRRGVFILQTRHPDHPLVRLIASGDYLAIARHLAREREQAQLPPYRPLAMIRAEARQAERAASFLDKVRRRCLAHPDLELAGPVEALMPKRAAYWRYQLWLLAPSRRRLIQVTSGLAAQIEPVAAGEPLRWHIDVDPLEV